MGAGISVAECLAVTTRRLQSDYFNHFMIGSN